jgi:hypothetical protein
MHKMMIPDGLGCSMSHRSVRLQLSKQFLYTQASVPHRPFEAHPGHLVSLSVHLIP